MRLWPLPDGCESVISLVCGTARRSNILTLPFVSLEITFFLIFFPPQSLKNFWADLPEQKALSLVSVRGGSYGSVTI